MGNFHLSETSKMRMAGIDPQLRKVVERAIQITKVDFGIPQYGGLRTVQDQQTLFDKGASKADGVENKSYHQTGRAVDFYAYVDGKATWDVKYMAQVACAFFQAAIDLGIDIEWGGLWTSFVDTPHIQLKKEA